MKPSGKTAGINRLSGKNRLRSLKAISGLLLFILISAFCFPRTAKAEEQHYIWENDWRIPIPKAYSTVDVIEYLGGEGGFLKGAEDLFIDKKDNMYVADTLNNRVLKLSLDGNTLGIFTGSPEKPLKNPKGIYVDDDGHIFIADTGNMRVIHLSSKGEYIEEFTKPESNLLSEDFTFDPSKISINSTGYLFVIKSQAFLSMDSNNGFRGYVGSTKVGFDFRRIVINLFASDYQKSQVIKELPDSYSNFTIDENGMIYATVINAEAGQIRKITTAGKNIYPVKFYGEITRSGWQSKMPNFADIAVDKNGIVSVIDQESGKIYQYDQEGNMLVAFGGFGNQKGTFEIPSSLALDSMGKLYALDQKANNIQVFEPTGFIKLVHEASRLYNEGRYAQSRDIWEKVLKIDGKYALAHRGIAKALLKEEKWKESMKTYKLADDQEGYSDAFVQYRHSIYRKYFGWIVLLGSAVIILLLCILKYLKRSSETELREHMGW